MLEFGYISHAEATAILEPRMSLFCTALQRAVREWREDFAQYHAWFDELARAVFINQSWNQHANALHRDDGGIVMLRHGNGRYFTVDERVDLRLKHADVYYQVWDHPTARAIARAEQRSFPTLPPLAHLDLAYRLDLAGTTIRDAIVMLRCGRNTVWRWQVLGPAVPEFAQSSRNLVGQVVYSRGDYSGVAP